MSEAVAELRQRKDKCNCIYQLIDELKAKYNLTSPEQAVALTFALWL